MFNCCYKDREGCEGCKGLVGYVDCEGCKGCKDRNGDEAFESYQFFYRCVKCFNPEFQASLLGHAPHYDYRPEIFSILFIETILPDFLIDYSLDTIFLKPLKFARLLRGKIRLDLIFIDELADKYQNNIIKPSDYPLLYQMLMTNLDDDDMVPINDLACLNYRNHYQLKFFLDIYLNRKLSFETICYGKINHIFAIFDHLLSRNRLSICESLLDNLLIDQDIAEHVNRYYRPIIINRKINRGLDRLPILAIQALSVFLQHWIY